MISKLRFPEFSEQYQVKELRHIAKKMVDRNGSSSAELVLTNSAVHGVISQADFFDKEIAIQGNLANYYKTKKDDFVYNPRISKNAPVGPFKRNNIGDGVMSPLYNLFRFHDGEVLDYLEQYLTTTSWHRYMKNVANYGARADRMAISISDLLSLPFPYPSKPEQEKIALFLKIVDKRIAIAEIKVGLLKKYRDGVIQKTFNQQIRFNDDEGTPYPEWRRQRLSNLLILRGERNQLSGTKEVFSVAKNAGVINQITHLGRSFASKDVSNYKVVYPNDVIYTKSPTSNFPYGIIKQNKLNRMGVVSVLYGVYKPKNQYVGYLLDAYFESWQNVYNYLNPIVQKGAKNTINIGDSAFLNGTTILFSDIEEEQKKITSILVDMDKKIKIEQIYLDDIKRWKKGLLQRMYL